MEKIRIRDPGSATLQPCFPLSKLRVKTFFYVAVAGVRQGSRDQQVPEGEGHRKRRQVHLQQGLHQRALQD